MDRIAAFLDDRFLVATDDRVFARHRHCLLDGLRNPVPMTVLSEPAGERTTSLTTLGRLLERAVAEGASRHFGSEAMGGWRAETTLSFEFSGPDRIGPVAAVDERLHSGRRFVESRTERKGGP